MLPGKLPSFVKRYADIYGIAARAVEQYTEDIKQGKFPDSDVAEPTTVYGNGSTEE